MGNKDTNYNNPVKQKTLMVFDEEARDKLSRGVELMYKAVCSTLSPKGRNVAINRNWGSPIVVHDGVTVAREVKDPDKFVQMGINLIKEAASKTNDEAGDGTTTSTLIAREIVKEGFSLVEKGVNPMVLREEVINAKDQALAGLQELTRPVKSRKDLERVAYISSASEEIGELVGGAVHKAGDNGLVTVEESGGYDTYVEHTEGLSTDKGFISPYFVTNPRQMEATIDKPYIIITDRTITINSEIVPIVEAIITKFGSKDIVIIGSVSGQALKTLVTNKVEGTINVLAIKPPSFGSHVKGFLEDIAVATGGKVISEHLGYTPEKLVENLDESWFGRADKIVADKNMTTIVGGRGDKKAVQKQVEAIKGLIEKEGNSPEKEKLEERVAKLSTGVSVVRVGAKTEVEAREKMEKVKDAVGSAQSAKEEGVVVGAGTTFLRLQEYVNKDTDGAKIVRKALGAVLKKILVNSGEDEENIHTITKIVRDSKNKSDGYEIMAGKVVDLNKEGILDPTKVVRLCLENGCSVATSILTTNTLIDYPEHMDTLK